MLSPNWFVEPARYFVAGSLNEQIVSDHVQLRPQGPGAVNLFLTKWFIESVENVEICG